MNRNNPIRVDAAAGNIAHHHQQQEPEIGPFRLAFRFKGDHGAIGVVASFAAMFLGEIGGQAIHVRDREM